MTLTLTLNPNPNPTPTPNPNPNPNQRLSLELVGAADAWAAGWGSSLQELARSYLSYTT